MVASRQASKKKPRTYADYREMLKEKDLDIVLIATPDHWHALPMIAAVEAGADVYVQKPISVDVVEGQAMLAAARKHQRRRAGRHAAPQHAAPDRGPRPDHPRGQARQDRPGRDLLLLPHAGRRATRPTRSPPDYLDYEMWTGPAPMRPYNSLVHPRGWRAFMEYGNGIVGDMCIHMLDMVRWMLGPRLAEADQLDGRHPGRQGEQGQHRRHADGHVRLRRPATSSGSIAPGATRPTRSIPGARPSTATRARSRPASTSYDFTPAGRAASRSTATSPTNWTSIPRTRPRRTWRSTSPRPIRGHMKDFLERDRHRAASRSPTSRKATSRRPAASWPTSPMKLGRSLTWDPRQAARRRRRGGEQAAAAAVSPPWVHPEPNTA